MMPTLYIGGYSPIGNIGGRPYLNVSVLMTMAAAAGMKRKRLFESIGDIFGRVPDDLEIPGAGYTFGTLKNAQATGDLQTLRSHGLPAERIRLEGDDPAAALNGLTEKIKEML